MLSLGGDLVHRRDEDADVPPSADRHRAGLPRAALVVLEASTRNVGEPHTRSRNLRARAFHLVRVCASTDMDMAVAFPARVRCQRQDAGSVRAWTKERVLKTTSGVNVAMLKLSDMLASVPGTPGGRGDDARTLASGFTELPAHDAAAHGLLRTEEGAPTLEEFLDVYDAALDGPDSENVADAATPPVLRCKPFSLSPRATREKMRRAVLRAPPSVSPTVPSRRTKRARTPQRPSRG